MNCAWGYTWHGRYFYHSWLLWIFLLTGIAVAVIFLLRKKQQKKCPGCDATVEEAYLRCPECGQELKIHCPGCYRIVENSWRTCPYCTVPLKPTETHRHHEKLQQNA